MHDKQTYYRYSDSCRIQDYIGYANLCNEIVLTKNQKTTIDDLAKQLINSNEVTKKPNRLLLIGRL